jgi:hypothetical protein
MLGNLLLPYVQLNPHCGGSYPLTARLGPIESFSTTHSIQICRNVGRNGEAFLAGELFSSPIDFLLGYIACIPRECRQCRPGTSRIL